MRRKALDPDNFFGRDRWQFPRLCVAVADEVINQAADNPFKTIRCVGGFRIECELTLELGLLGSRKKAAFYLGEAVEGGTVALKVSASRYRGLG